MIGHFYLHEADSLKEGAGGATSGLAFPISTTSGMKDASYTSELHIPSPYINETNSSAGGFFMRIEEMHMNSEYKSC